ncbi:MAG: AgmX/PglI C-terminal domain-containing protein [Myxococcota bacterium]|nr:AgmX/PglI C-terminal domain-containing protein [Myxococcota bacterium]
MKANSIVILFMMCGLFACAGASNESLPPSSRAAGVSSHQSTKTSTGASAGFYPTDAVERGVNSRVRDIQVCYEKQLEISPKLEGRIEVSWVIAKDGRVTELTTKGMPAIAPCIADVLRSITFLPPFGATQVVSGYPFVFKVK